MNELLPKRRIIALCVAALTLLAAAGCAKADNSVSVEALSDVSVGQSTESAAPSGVSDAAVKLREATKSASEFSTGRFELTSEAGRRGGFQAVVKGSFDRDTKASEITTELPGGLGGEGSLTVRTIDGVVFLDASSFGMIGDLFGIDTPWVSFDAGKFADGEGISLPGLDRSSDPTSVLDMLRGVSGEVTEVGSEQVRGVDTTHYKASVVPAKALDELSEERQGELRDTLGDVLDKPVPVDLWVDADGLLRRASLAYDLGSTGGTLAINLELFDLGEPVSIAAPPADEVTSMEDLSFLSDLFGN